MAYLYRHIRLDKNEPFYIGIGSDEDGKYLRAYSTSSRNKHWENIINLTKFDVEILLDNLTWEEACEKEKEFIKLYGRKNLNTGTLVNWTDGGEGTLNTVITDETRKKMSKSQKGNQTWLGKHHKNETKEKISKSLIGKPNGWDGRKHTEESKKKISATSKKRIPWNKGKKNIYSPETIEKLAASKRGNKFRVGKKHTDETKRLIGVKSKQKYLKK